MLDSLLIPFRGQPQPPQLPPGYSLELELDPPPEELNALLVACGEPKRSPDRLRRALERSDWCLSIRNTAGQLVGFARVTTDQALNANIWDLVAHPVDPSAAALLLVLVYTLQSRLRREMPGCGMSLAASPMALAALHQHGFVVDPGGIRAMGLRLQA